MCVLFLRIAGLKWTLHRRGLMTRIVMHCARTPFSPPITRAPNAPANKRVISYFLVYIVRVATFGTCVCACELECVCVVHVIVWVALPVIPWRLKRTHTHQSLRSRFCASHRQHNSSSVAATVIRRRAAPLPAVLCVFHGENEYFVRTCVVFRVCVCICECVARRW